MCSRLVIPVLALLLFLSPVFPGPSVMAMPKGESPSGSPTVTGTVVETMNAAGYTYMLVDSDGKKTWVAIPATTVAQGTEVTYYQGMVMKSFTSKTLNRTFDNLIFSAGLAGEKAGTAPQTAADDTFSAALKAEEMAGDPPAPTPETVTTGGSVGAIAPMEEITVDKATAENGYTVGEIFSKAKELTGQKVQVHGKVVKFNPKIMGRNWLHLQDGSGDPMQNSHDLVVTTEDTVEVGSIITIDGVLAADKDFGAGYKYAAIVEDASIIK